ncbi:MAG: amidohydrolase family protein [Chloroflexi bacterium]|nr:amidohydrolase family protein [Chloroflexota bacterium]
MTLKIANAAYVITLDAQRRILSDGAVLVEDGRITRVGKTAELKDVPADQIIDATGCVITPAFVNGHMHISYAHAVRGNFPDDFVGRERLREVFRLQSAMTEQEEYATSLLAIVELVKNGTVTFVDPGSTKYVDACLQAYAEAGCRVITGISLIDTPGDLHLPCLPTDQALQRTREFVERFDGKLDGRVRAWTMPFSPDTCSSELISGAKRLADELGTWMTVHHSGGWTASLRDTGALGSNVLLAHAAGIDDGEVELIADAGASVVVCPSTTQKEGGGLGTRKVPELRARGVAVGLGCDSANSSNFLDPVRAMHALAVGLKDGRRDARVISAEQVLEMATIDGARALGMQDQIGSIEVGKQADLVLFETRTAEWRSLLDPVNNLVYAADGRSVRTVVASGRVVVENGRVVFADEAALAEQVQHMGEDLLARTGARINRGRWPIV